MANEIDPRISQAIERQKLAKKRGEKRVTKSLRKLYGKRIPRQKSLKARQQKRRIGLGIAGLLGATGKRQQLGRGRPRGSFKYGMPIQVYKKLQARQKALYKAYQDKQVRKLAQRGLTPEMVRRLQLQRITQAQTDEYEMPTELLEAEVPQRVAKQQQVREVVNQADDEMKFRRWLAQKTISPRTQQILLNIRRIQNKGQRDNIEQQRRILERNLVGRSMNLMKAHENMTKVNLDFSGVNPEENILSAPNIFKETASNQHILKRRNLSILNTKEAGNNLKF